MFQDDSYKIKTAVLILQMMKRQKQKKIILYKL